MDPLTLIRQAQALLTQAEAGLVPAAPTYAARTDREVALKGPTPTLGPAGYTFTDPVFGTRITRITDEHTDPAGLPMRVPSNAAVSPWSCDSSRFALINSGVSTSVYGWSGTSAAPICRLPGYIEPCWSYVNPRQIYIGGGPNGRTVRRATVDDLGSVAFEDIFDADTKYPKLALTDTYLSNLMVADDDTWVVAFGGGQDTHHFIEHSKVGFAIDTLDGSHRIHALALDRTGRRVVIFPPGADVAGGIPPAIVWDTQAGTFTGMGDSIGGHACVGYGQYLNTMDAGNPPYYDGMQWLLRSLAHPTERPTILVLQKGTPQEIYIADHTSWRSARPDIQVPVISMTLRFNATLNKTPPRAWDDELLAVATDESGTVWRFAHHRSRYDGRFWDQPMAHVNPTGQYVLFHSNWDNTLGTYEDPNEGTLPRQDVFVATLR